MAARVDNFRSRLQYAEKDVSYMYPVISPTSKIVVSNPSFGVSPSGFARMHLEILPREVSRLVGYDPRSLIMKPRKAGAKSPRGTRDIVPHNISTEIIGLQNKIQRSIDGSRVAEMVEYLANALESGKFADWGAIELVTASQPVQVSAGAELDADADYFIADGQHRYCALLDLIRAYPVHADRFTQGITISVMPHEKMVEWAGQKFHDHNYFSVPVRAGKALAVDTRDPINALAKSLDAHPAITEAGGVAYDRDTLLAGDTRFASHSTMHRFVRGFLFGRPGLDKGTDARVEVDQAARDNLWAYIAALAEFLPWRGGPDSQRDAYLTRTSVMLAALSVVGHDLFKAENALSEEARETMLYKLTAIDWRRSNLALVGVIGSEKNGLVQPASSRPAIDSTIRFLREKVGLIGTASVAGPGSAGTTHNAKQRGVN